MVTTYPRPGLSALPLAWLSDDARATLGDIDEVVVFILPMNIRFRGITRREGILLRGPAGWGEFAPFWDYGAVESSRWLASGIASATIPTPRAVRGAVPVNVTIPACSVKEALQRVEKQRGCRTAKVKVAERGQLLEEDLERVEAVARALYENHGAEARIRIDANAGWSVPDAVEMLDALNRAARVLGGLEYAEQPVGSTEDLAELKSHTRVPLAADESIRRSDDPQAVRDMSAADIAVLKVAPLGGIAQARRLGSAIGLPTVVSSALDSSVGIAAAVALAASLPNLQHACGLNTATMFVGDVLAEPLVAVDGQIDVEQAKVATLSALNPHADEVESSVKQLWHERLERVASVLRKGEEQR